MCSLSRFLTLGGLLLAACGDADATEASTRAPATAAPRASAPGAAPPPDPVDGEGAGLIQPAQVSRSGGWQHYGGGFGVPADQAISCEALLADLDAYVDKTVRVEGRVADVCQARGCWMVITPSQPTAADQMIRVTMKDHAFSVDKQGAGKQTELEGVLVRVPVDADTVAHYESEAGTTGAVPEQQGTAAGYELVASTVRIRN